jgi:membrane protease YdiL (CAAX protease family)
MTPRRKLLLLVMSLLLPAVLLACSHVFVAGLMQVGDSDRAIVWAQGAASDIETVRVRIESSDVFRAGRVAKPPRPDYVASDCGPDAVQLSFGGLGLHDGQAAREALELLAAQAGLQVCASGIFIISDASTGDAAERFGFVAQHLLLYVLVPGGIATCLYWMLREQWQLPALLSARSAGPGIGLGLIAALGLVAVTAAINLAFGLPWSGDRPGFTPGTDAAAVFLGLALIGLSPVIEELAYRAWLITLAERALGAWAAGALSSLTFAASHLPASGREWLLGMLLGAVCSALYLRTRSLWAPVAANAGFSLMLLGASTALG